MTVIDFNTVTRLEPKRERTVCRCQRVFVVEKTRMLECQDCGKVIDSYDFLWDEAQKQQNLALSTKHLRSERERLSEEISGLKKQRTNLKAQVRRLQGKASRDAQ